MKSGLFSAHGNRMATATSMTSEKPLRRKGFVGVIDGARTRDLRSHSPAL